MRYLKRSAYLCHVLPAVHTHPGPQRRGPPSDIPVGNVPRRQLGVACSHSVRAAAAADLPFEARRRTQHPHDGDTDPWRSYHGRLYRAPVSTPNPSYSKLRSCLCSPGTNWTSESVSLPRFVY